MSSSATTPEDEDMSMEDDTGETTDNHDISDFGVGCFVIHINL